MRTTFTKGLISDQIDLSIVLPVFNEAGNLTPLVKEIREALLPMAGISFEILAVDDASTDGSVAELKQLAADYPELKVIFFCKNMGQAAAFDAGFQNAVGKVVASMDADLQNDPRDIPALLARLSEGFDVVSGWRKSRKDGFWLRRIPSLACNFLIRKITRTAVHDLGCSLRVYRAEVLQELRLYGEMHRFICPLLEINGARVAELEVHHRPRVLGQSKYGIGRVFKVVLDLMHVWFLQNYQTKPIYAFGGVGLIMAGAGTLAATYSLFEKFAHGVRVHNNPLFSIAITLLMMGFNMIGAGLMAEFMIRTYFESQDKSPYPIREVIGISVKGARQKRAA